MLNIETAEHESSGAQLSEPASHRLALLNAHINPTYLGYLIGPLAFVVIVVLMHFGYVAKEPVWLWAVVFVAVPLTTFSADRLYGAYPGRWTLNSRVALPAAGVTAVIYLSGWGPVLWGAFVFSALANMSNGGSKVWRTTALWSVAGMLTGQICIWQGWMPSKLSLGEANALAFMGAFLLVFVIRMAGATLEEKEDAEGLLRMSEDRFRSLIHNSSDVTLVINIAGNFTYASPAVRDLTGYKPHELLGKNWADFVHPDDGGQLRDRLGPRFQEAHQTALIRFRIKRKGDRWRDVEAVVSNQVDRPSVAGYVANVRDITERKKFEAVLAHRALHDPLTGLANRQLILDRADQMLSRARRRGDPVAAFFIDLDNFKDVNDSLGHEAGDRLLQAVAQRLRSLLRASDTVGRMGGDEFVIFTDDLSLSDGAETVAERIRQVLRAPFQLDGFQNIPLTVTASIGIATGDRPSSQDLLRDADLALYQSKIAGRDRSTLFELAMRSANDERLELRSDLDLAFANHEFFLLYQPIFDLRTLEIRGVEALLRWHHPAKGVITADEFIPALEDSGRIVEVGRWVLNEACRQAAVWHSQGYRPAMSVNISMRQLESDLLCDDVRDAIELCGLDPEGLIIEVTETALMKDAEATVARLKHLKELGVAIAIDDFGTGYSSLSYVRQFPVDVLKIDRTFVSEMDCSPSAAALIHTLIELGRTLGLVTLAEGIEEPSQLKALRSSECETGQGRIFSGPLTASTLEGLLSQTSGDLLTQQPALVAG